MPVSADRFFVTLARVVAILLLLAMLLLAVILPPLVKNLCAYPDLIGDRSTMTAFDHGLVLTLAYTMLAIAMASVAVLLGLLTEISRGRVFTALPVRLLTVVSVCCFVESLLFLILGIYFQLAFAVAVATAFIGLCLLVVRNVLSEACRIKTENDFTV